MNTSNNSEIPIQTQALRIAIQGVEGSYHELAARQFFGPDIELVCCDSFPELFRNLKKPSTDFAVAAIENSVAGTILPNYALMRDSGYSIIGEAYLRISHMLMALPGTSLADIREVHSHPMALQQCLGFLGTLPGIRLVESDDTAASAERIATNQREGIAAIAGRHAAEKYGLEIIAQAIEDDPGNFTRFFVLGPEEAKEKFFQKPDKASLCFSLRHSVGSLAQILMVLSAHGMNLTKIQSSPMVGKAWEYFFHLDLEFEEYDQYQRSLASIRSLVSDFKIIGEYPKAHKTPQDQ
ncbi:MAG: prephenate dehydratase [Bacteroidia bacterium]|nr:prephenate dehydratase [Bacteroidia bacterium]